MAILDSLKKSKEKAEVHTTPALPGHTVSEILKDKNKFHIFGELLRREGHTDLAVRIRENKLQESDIDLLEQNRKIFSEQMALSEKTEKFLTKENIIAFAKRHPELEKIINVFGPDQAVKVIQAQLKEISITDESRFNTILSAIETATTYQSGEAKSVNEEIEKLCKEKHIKPQAYLDALSITDPVDRDEALKKLVTILPEKREGWKKVLNIFHTPKGSYDRETFDKLADSAIKLEDTIAQLNIHEADIGAALSYTLSSNDKMRDSLFAEMAGENMPGEPKVGFKELKQTTFNKQEEQEWNDNWEAKKIADNYDTRPPDEQRDIRDSFAAGAKEVYRRERAGSSFWEQITSALTEAFIDDKAVTLS